MKKWIVYSWMPRGNGKERRRYCTMDIMARNRFEARGRFLKAHPSEAGRLISIYRIMKKAKVRRVPLVYQKIENTNLIQIIRNGNCVGLCDDKYRLIAIY